MTTFVLVHGAWHGAWCWERLTPLLQQAGHGVITPDLPSADGAASTFDAYADVVCAALSGCDDDVVVVRHSLGAPTATLVTARRPVRHLVYLCGAVPTVGRSLFDQWQNDSGMINPEWDNGLSEPDVHLRTTWVNRAVAQALLYTDCHEATAANAFDRLRPQSAHPFTAPCSLTEFPAIGCTSVVCSEDQLINPDWSRRIAHDIGATIVELPGSHSPLLAQPATVADILLQIAVS